MVCSESESPRQLDLDSPTIPDRRPAASQPSTVHVTNTQRFILGTITTCTQYTGFILQEDVIGQLPDAEGLQWRDSSLHCLTPPASEPSGEQPTCCSVATSDRTDEDAQSSSPETVQETEAVLSTDHHDFSLSIHMIDSVTPGFEESSQQCRNINERKRKVSEKQEKLFYIRLLLHQLSGKNREISRKLKRELENTVAIDCERIWFVETHRFNSIIGPVLQQAEHDGDREQAHHPDACDLLTNHSIRQLSRELDSVLPAFKISLVLAPLFNNSLHDEQTLQPAACDLTNSITRLARELESVPIAEYAFNISLVLAPLLSSSLLLLLLLTLAKLKLRYKLLLFDLEFSDVTQLLKLFVFLGLLSSAGMLSSASLLRTLHKQVRTNSSETIVIISITLSCCVKLTSSAPPHLPNLLMRMVEGEGGTFYVPLLGSPNTGYCANIAIGVKHPQEFCVLVDTGSANLAVAGKAHPDIDTWFNPQLSSNFTNLGQTVSVSYTTGDWTGTLAKDYVAIQGPSHSWYDHIEAFFVLITESQHFFINDAAWAGILGMAYGSLAKPDSSVETFLESLRRITGMKDQFSLQFCPPLDIPLLDITEPQGGAMVLGELNHSLYHGTIFYTDIVEQRFYNVLVSNVTIGNVSISLDCTEFNNDQSIVDSGTTDIFFPKTVFAEVKNTFIAHFKDGRPLPVPSSFWVGGSKLAWPADNKATIFRAFPTLYLAFATSGNASEEFSLAITPQIYLRQIEGTSAEQHETNCFPECDFFTFGIKQRERGTVIGGNVMLGFFSLFDRESQRIGFAASTCEYQDPHNGLPHIVGPYPRTPQDCMCYSCKPGRPYWEIISYVCGSIVCPLAIVSIICAICGRRYRKREAHEDKIKFWKRVTMNLGKCCSFLRCCRFARRVNYPIAEMGGGEEAETLMSLEMEGAARSTEVMETLLDSEQIGSENGSDLGEVREGGVSLEGEGNPMNTEVMETELRCGSELENEGGDGDEQTSHLQETTLLSTQIESKLAQSKGTPEAGRRETTKRSCEGTPLLQTEVNLETESAINLSKPRGRPLKKHNTPRSGESTAQRKPKTHFVAPQLVRVFSGTERLKDSTTVMPAVRLSQKGAVLEQNLSVKQSDFEPRTAELSQCDIKVACGIPSKKGTNIPSDYMPTKDEGYCSRQTSRQDSQMGSEDFPHRGPVDRQKSSGNDSAFAESDSDHEQS